MPTQKEKVTDTVNWAVIERPGYLGKTKDAKEAEWNLKYGDGNWRYAWELKNGEVWDFDQVFWQVYVAGYTRHFINHIAEAIYVTDRFSYTYDKELVTREQAFDPHFLYGRPGHANQFHNVAMNLALTYYLGLPFSGSRPLQVREGKPGTPANLQPEGYLWSPGRIIATRADLIPQNLGGWWQKGSIEDFYQSAKVVQAKTA